MLMRTDPFRELDRLTQQFLGVNGTTVRPVVMPLDAYRQGDQLVVHLDLPGIDVDSIDLEVERNALTVRAERRLVTGDDAEFQVAERPRGTFSRQLLLGNALDADRIEASYDCGVLTLRIPMAERAEPRRIAISSGDGSTQIDA
ncbi:Hsp20/alpha crystallin family protein [Pseudonocardia bannensis]|uniref:Hsp20/alpha crystallin family protein n=1 Tax=Pseudonocardia bannensis TaxID=630973 RepID=A0A848DMQ1_9PSEU|nr:Hsp20/alpha crystallin family protein [Pseudonocardia bannensis]NMH94070.1 Hsp20/alpha crystallin family protein [Pseudonocardia bannensis]